MSDTQLGPRLLDAIHAAGYPTVYAFAKAADVHPTIVQRWVSGENSPTVARLMAVCRAAGVHVAVLFQERHPLDNR